MDIIEMARELGAALQKSDEYTAYNVAKNAADSDTELQGMIGDFNLKKLSLSAEVQKEDKDQEKLAAMQGGHMTFCFLNSKNAKPYTESGDLKILATIAGTGDRDPQLPDIPSLYELGYTTCLFGTDFYILGPKDMDPAAVEKLNAAIGELIGEQSVVDVHETINMPVQWLSVEDSIARAKDTRDSIFTVAKAIGLMEQDAA